MSKICENCGNMIPDGSTACPGCGMEQLGEDNLNAVLDDLSYALDQLVDESDGEKSDNDVNISETIVFSKKNSEEKGQDAAPSVIASAMNVAAQKEQEKNDTEEEAPKKQKKSAEKKPAQKPGKSGTAKKRKKKKASSTTVLGIIIGLILALLVVAGAALLMLYKMGFFELLSDDQILGTTASGETYSVQEMPESIPSPVVSETPVQEPDSVVEERPTLIEPEISMEEPVEPTVAVTKFTLTGANDMTFNSRGQTAEIVYVIAPEEAQWEIEWKSSDETVATVSNFGVITARRGGDCTITGSCGDFEVSVAVHCAFTVPTTVLDMNYDDITMDHEGQEVQLKIDYELTDEQIAATVWESTDEAVATVDEDGLVTAISDGTAVVSAAIGEYTASCIIRCVNVTGNRGVNSDDSEYVINYEDVTLTRKGEYFELTLKSILGNEVPAFTWKSSDSQIAKVDSKGVVTAVSDGTCKITTSIGQDDFECIVRVRISG